MLSKIELVILRSVDRNHFKTIVLKWWYEYHILAINCRNRFEPFGRKLLTPVRKRSKPYRQLKVPSFIHSFIHLHPPSSSSISLHLPSSTLTSINLYVLSSTSIGLHLPSSTFICLHEPLLTFIYKHLPPLITLHLG